MAKVDKRHRRMIREQLDAVDFFDPPKAKPKKVRQLVKIANNPTHPRHRPRSTSCTRLSVVSLRLHRHEGEVIGRGKEGR